MTNSQTNIKILPIPLTTFQFEQVKNCLSSLDWTVFLESADTNHVDSNWSIISALPIATIQSFSGKTIFKQGDLVEKQNTDPFELLKNKREAIFSCGIVSDELPFTGGVLGAIDYELGYQFEDIENNKNPKTLSLPELSLGFYDWALLCNHKTDQFYLVTHRTTGSKISVEEQWHIKYQWLMKLIKGKKKKSDLFMLSSEWLSNMDKQQYTEKFNKVQAYILSGDCYQVNLAQRFKANYKGDEYQAYQQLLAQNRPPFGAFLRLPNQVILSLSPERF